MKLREWRETSGNSAESVAIRFGVTPSLWSRWERGTHIPRPKQMERIVLLTGGAVSPNDFYDLVKEQRAEKMALSAPAQGLVDLAHNAVAVRDLQEDAA